MVASPSRVSATTCGLLIRNGVLKCLLLSVGGRSAARPALANPCASSARPVASWRNEAEWSHKGTLRGRAPSMIGTWRSVARLLQGTHRLVIASVAISVVQSALLVPIAFIVRRIFDVTIPDGRSSELVLLGLATLLLFVGGSALGLLTRWLSLRATKESIRRLQARLLEQLVYSPKTYFDRADLGDLHSVVVQDSIRIDAMANSIVSILIPAVILGLVLGVTMIFLNPLLGSLLLVVAPVMIVSGRL